MELDIRWGGIPGKWLQFCFENTRPFEKEMHQNLILNDRLSEQQLKGKIISMKVNLVMNI